MVRPQRSSTSKATKKYKEGSSDEESEWEDKGKGQQGEETDEAQDEDFELDGPDGGNDDDDHVDKPEQVKSIEPHQLTNKRTPFNKGTGKKRKRPSEYDTDDEDEEDQLPTYVRKTDKGGYAHTKASRAKIGKANKGKSPWNKGKNRSEEVKAKIRAGVVARNRAVLAVKLTKLGITEAEWIAKQKEIKYLRERVRRAKVAASKRKEESNLVKLEQELNDALASTNDAADVTNIDTKIEQEEEVAATNVPASCEEEKKDDHAGLPVNNSSSSNNLRPSYRKDVIWEPHTFDEKGIPKCPIGGPGGLICCSDCSSAFSGFLTDTARDAELQTRHNVGKEVQELLGYVEESRFAIMTAVQVARKQPLPPTSVSGCRQFAPGKRPATDGSVSAEDVEWTMTSVMDLTNRGEHEARI